jgi:dsDNA-specific endonuclease/ATPase MutS2
VAASDEASAPPPAAPLREPSPGAATVLAVSHDVPPAHGGATEASPEDATVLAISDELDLHTFLPRECADLVAEYVSGARAAGLREVRIIHGKGRGALRRTVHAALARHAAVLRYRLAPPDRGGWGATLVELKPRERGPPPSAEP